MRVGAGKRGVLARESAVVMGPRFDTPLVRAHRYTGRRDLEKYLEYGESSDGVPYRLDIHV